MKPGAGPGFAFNASARGSALGTDQGHSADRAQRVELLAQVRDLDAQVRATATRGAALRAHDFAGGLVRLFGFILVVAVVSAVRGALVVATILARLAATFRAAVAAVRALATVVAGGPLEGFELALASFFDALVATLELRFHALRLALDLPLELLVGAFELFLLTFALALLLLRLALQLALLRLVLPLELALTLLGCLLELIATRLSFAFDALELTFELLALLLELALDLLRFALELLGVALALLLEGTFELDGVPFELLVHALPLLFELLVLRFELAHAAFELLLELTLALLGLAFEIAQLALAALGQRLLMAARLAALATGFRAAARGSAGNRRRGSRCRLRRLLASSHRVSRGLRLSPVVESEADRRQSEREHPKSVGKGHGSPQRVEGRDRVDRVKASAYGNPAHSFRGGRPDRDGWPQPPPGADVWHRKQLA